MRSKSELGIKSDRPTKWHHQIQYISACLILILPISCGVKLGLWVCSHSLSIPCCKLHKNSGLRTVEWEAHPRNLNSQCFQKKKHLCAKWHIDLFLYTVFLSQHLELLFKLIIQQVLLHNQLMWNGRYNIVKNNEKSGKNYMQSNQAGWFRGFRFSFTPQQGLDLL